MNINHETHSLEYCTITNKPNQNLYFEIFYYNVQPHQLEALVDSFLTDIAVNL